MADKRPAFLFYVGDWLKDTSLRSVSVEARGVWIDMLCLMHESARRGYLQHANGKPVTLDQLARMTGCSTEQVSRLLQELIDSGVCSCTAHGSIYNRRMVRDEQKRLKCSEAGKRGVTLKGRRQGQPKGDPQGLPENENEDIEEFVLTPIEPKTDQVQEKLKSVVASLHARHPAKRSCGPKEIRNHLEAILRKVKPAERLGLLSRIDENHRLHCETEQWRKDDGEFAKGLVNWLAPSKERFLEPPPAAECRQQEEPFSNEEVEAHWQEMQRLLRTGMKDHEADGLARKMIAERRKNNRGAA